MNNTNKVLSIALNKHNLHESVQVDTVTTGGMYSFEILGIPTKQSTEIKQKVYTSLRSKNILNIKSDNRKIYSSVTSGSHLIETGNMELAILVSCYNCIAKKNIFSNSFIMGRINITGEIGSTRHLIQSIYLATREGIKNIICPFEDFNRLPSGVLNYCYTNNISIKPASSIQELFYNTNLNTDAKCAEVVEVKNEPHNKKVFEIFNNIKEHPLLWPLVVSICGKHDLLFYTNKTIDTERLLLLIQSIHPNYTTKETLFLSHIFNLDDESALKIPYFEINNQPSIENIFSKHKKEERYIKQLYLISTCPCKNTAENCICNVRSKKFYRDKISKSTDDLSCIRLHITPKDLDLSIDMSTVKIILETIISSETIFSEISNETLSYIDTLCTKMSHIDKKLVLDVAKTIYKIDHFLDKTSILTKKTILLAFSLMQSKI